MKPAVRGPKRIQPFEPTISAMTGDGLDVWLRLLGTPGPWGQQILTLDYDRYARAEASLGWLNAAISSQSPSDWVEFARDFLKHLVGEIRPRGRLIHVKLHIKTPLGWLRAAVTPAVEDPILSSVGSTRGPRLPWC